MESADADPRLTFTSPPDKPDEEAEEGPIGYEPRASALGAHELELPQALVEAKGGIEEHLRNTLGESMGAVEALSLERPGSNIQGVAVQVGRVEGLEHPFTAAEPGKPALTVYLAEPLSPEQLERVIVEDLGVKAAAASEVPVNPVVTGLIEARPHQFRARPAPGGISVAHSDVTAGTFGCLARGRSAPRSDRVLILSNHHVLANGNNGKYGDCVCQPGPFDGGACPADQVAILERFVPITFGSGVNYVDCATAWAWPDRVSPWLVYPAEGSYKYMKVASEPAAAQVGMTVGKTGRTTQLTEGTVAALDASITVNYDAGQVAMFEGQISIESSGGGEFSQGGDSGSCIWTWTEQANPVGLLFAGGQGITFANPIQSVLDALEINLY